MLSSIEQARLQISQNTEAKKKSQLGQFLTPARTAKFMAGLFTPTGDDECRLLDAGAGIGSLSDAFLKKCTTKEFQFKSIHLDAFEIDDTLHKELNRTFLTYSNKLPFTYKIFGDDFIESAIFRIQFGQTDFTHAILNPPYKKINSKSRHRRMLRMTGIETVNLYSAFVALCLLLMKPGGQVVAIIPRSFCNGPYYHPFREIILKQASIKHMHLFASRDKAFKDDKVLQENIIISLEREGKQGCVTISTSTDDDFSDVITHEYPFNQIVHPDDLEQFIHVPTSPEINFLEKSPDIRYSLDDIDVEVSTGPVVDFRVKEHLLDMPERGTVPLLYPGHFHQNSIEWPKENSKKPNAIQRNEHTEKWLFPNGYYCVVRRFSSKEEHRRIQASVVDPTKFEDTPMLGFENHLNVFHINKQGLSQALANGLAVFLNSTAVDENFRSFNGHTQVNATDLKTMKYPNRETLIELGKWATDNPNLSQSKIDTQLEILFT